jgi:hypothetical protein
MRVIALNSAEVDGVSTGSKWAAKAPFRPSGNAASRSFFLGSALGPLGASNACCPKYAEKERDAVTVCADVQSQHVFYA